MATKAEQFRKENFDYLYQQDDDYTYTEVCGKEAKQILSEYLQQSKPYFDSTDYADDYLDIAEEYYSTDPFDVDNFSDERYLLQNMAEIIDDALGESESESENTEESLQAKYRRLYLMVQKLYIEGLIHGTLITNDDMSDENDEHPFSALTSPVFVHEPLMSDIDESLLNLHPEYIILANFADMHPDMLKGMFRDNNDGTLTIRFYKKNDLIFEPYMCYIDKSKAYADWFKEYRNYNMWPGYLAYALGESGIALSEDNVSQVIETFLGVETSDDAADLYLQPLNYESLILEESFVGEKIIKSYKSCLAAIYSVILTLNSAGLDESPDFKDLKFACENVLSYVGTINPNSNNENFAMSMDTLKKKSDLYRKQCADSPQLEKSCRMICCSIDALASSFKSKGERQNNPLKYQQSVFISKVAESLLKKKNNEASENNIKIITYKLAHDVSFKRILRKLKFTDFAAEDLMLINQIVDIIK